MGPFYLLSIYQSSYLLYSEVMSCQVNSQVQIPVIASASKTERRSSETKPKNLSNPKEKEGKRRKKRKKKMGKEGRKEEEEGE